MRRAHHNPRLTKIERAKRDLAKWEATYAKTGTVGAYDHIVRLRAEIASLNEKRNPRRAISDVDIEATALDMIARHGSRDKALQKAWNLSHDSATSKNKAKWKAIAQHIQKQSNPVPSSAPSRALLCVGQLRQLELYDPKTGRTGTVSPKGKWLAWDGKQFQICNVKGQVNASLPSKLVARHRKFHAANPIGKPFLGSMPDRGPTVKNVGLLKSLVYYVPSKIRSPGKNKYLWHHAFGDTGHKGGDSYPTKVMPMLQRDSAGNLFIKRRPGNIFRVDNWLRG